MLTSNIVLRPTGMIERRVLQSSPSFYIIDKTGTYRGVAMTPAQTHSWNQCEITS